MSAFEEASQWMDVRRFETDCADGDLWAGNIRLASTVTSQLFKGTFDAPRWLEKNELGGMPFLPIKRRSRTNARNTQTVGTLTACHLFDVMDILRDDLEKRYGQDCYPPVPIDESCPYLFNPIASINLQAPDAVIVEDFKRWLVETREAFNFKPLEKNRRDRITVLKENQVLPYIWLQSWMAVTGNRLTNAQQARILFPDDDDRYAEVDIVEKLRKRTAVLARDYIDIDPIGNVSPNRKGIASLRYSGVERS